MLGGSAAGSWAPRRERDAKWSKGPSFEFGEPSERRACVPPRGLRRSASREGTVATTEEEEQEERARGFSLSSCICLLVRFVLEPMRKTVSSSSFAFCPFGLLRRLGPRTQTRLVYVSLHFSPLSRLDSSPCPRFFLRRGHNRRQRAGRFSLRPAARPTPQRRASSSSSFASLWPTSIRGKPRGVAMPGSEIPRNCTKTTRPPPTHPHTHAPRRSNRENIFPVSSVAFFVLFAFYFYFILIFFFALLSSVLLSSAVGGIFFLSKLHAARDAPSCTEDRLVFPLTLNERKRAIENCVSVFFIFFFFLTPNIILLLISVLCVLCCGRLGERIRLFTEWC